MISLSVDRSSLNLGPLVFVADPSSGRWVRDLSYPAKRWRRQYAEGANLHGSLLMRATLEHATIAGTLYVQAATTAALETKKGQVEAAFGQFFYTVTVTIDGQQHTHNADPADLDWGPADEGMAAAFMASTPVSIPVYPLTVGA